LREGARVCYPCLLQVPFLSVMSVKVQASAKLAR
jgi:hypothetical protein